MNQWTRNPKIKSLNAKGKNMNEFGQGLNLAEWLFSAAARIITKRRGALHDDSAENLIVLQEYDGGKNGIKMKTNKYELAYPTFDFEA